MILEQILEHTRERVKGLPEMFPAPYYGDPRSLSDAIRSVRGKNAIIGELKFSSPVDGMIRPASRSLQIAKELERRGCAGLSILTEPAFFGGVPGSLAEIRMASRVPVLRKDFIIDKRQVYETRAMGADAILLIARILRENLAPLVSLSLKLGMEPVVEVHDPADVECARATDAGIIGINNRDLETMQIDLATTGRIAPLCGDATIISMSGIRTDDDIRRMKGSCHAFLIGTALMKARHPGVAMEGFVSA